MDAPYYESDAALSQYLLLHYGRRADIAPEGFVPDAALDFPVRCVRAMIDPADVPEGARALDLGCAVGRSSFELARFCRVVIGIDFSQRFIDAANLLNDRGRMDIEVPVQGDIRRRIAVTPPDGVDRTRVRFRQGDAHALPAEIGSFDVVLAANLLCRMNEPARLLARLPSLVKPGGHLVLTTPSTWSHIHTPRANWIGGVLREGAPLRTLDGLREALDRDFELDRRADLPLVIREHERKFEYIVAEATAWRRRSCQPAAAR